MTFHNPKNSTQRGRRERLVRDRESERLLLKGGSAVERASVVWGDEAKNGSIPPTRGLRVGERERERRRDK